MKLGGFLIALALMVPVAGAQPICAFSEQDRTVCFAESADGGFNVNRPVHVDVREDVAGHSVTAIFWVYQYNASSAFSGNWYNSSFTGIVLATYFTDPQGNDAGVIAQAVQFESSTEGNDDSHSLFTALEAGAWYIPEDQGDVVGVHASWLQQSAQGPAGASCWEDTVQVRAFGGPAGETGEREGLACALVIPGALNAVDFPDYPALP